MEKVIKIDKIPFKVKINEEFGRVEHKDDKVIITSIEGTDLALSPDGNSNCEQFPNISFAPEGDFIFSSAISVDFKNAYEGGFLFIYSEEKKWCKVFFERFESGKNGISTTVANNVGDDAYHTTTSSNKLWLKTVRNGDIYAFYYSTDGDDWNFLRTFMFKSKKDILVGFASQSPFNKETNVEFSDLRYAAKSVTDFWQGE